MVIYILACAASFIPSLALYFWLRNSIKNDKAYQKLCGNALIKGILCAFLIVLISGICYILLRLTRLHEHNPLLYKMIYTFIVLALAEETVKFLTFHKVLKKTDYPCSWLDVTVLMTIVSIGFGLIETVTIAIGATIPIILVRGICVPHAGYGFVTGYFYGKGLKTGKKTEKWTGFVLSWFIHGLYDFSLSEEFIAINENLMFVALGLAVLDILLVINLIIFVQKEKKSESYIQPLINTEK